MRVPVVPPKAVPVKTYQEFAAWLGDFAQGHFPFLWVFGRPGLSKTEGIKRATRGAKVYHHKGGRLTPLQFYKDVYAHRGQPIILDDAEDLLNDKTGRELLSALGETTAEKEIPWRSTTRGLGEGVPLSFMTTSPLCIIANVNTADAKLQSRAVAVLHFDPPNQEIHREAANWFWDQEIHDWIGQHLTRLEPLDCRWYDHAYRYKQTHRDWRKLLLDTYGIAPISSTVQDLETDPAYPTRKDKERRFNELMGNERGASRASYFRIRARLEERGALTVEPMPTIPLFRRTPPGTPGPVELAAMAESPPPTTRPRTIVDSPDADLLAWERRQPEEDEQPSIP